MPGFEPRAASPGRTPHTLRVPAALSVSRGQQRQPLRSGVDSVKRPQTLAPKYSAGAGGVTGAHGPMLSLRLRTGAEGRSGGGHRSASSHPIRATQRSRAHQPAAGLPPGGGDLGPSPIPGLSPCFPRLLHRTPGTKYLTPSFFISHGTQGNVLLKLFRATAYLNWEGTSSPVTSTSNWVSCHSARSDSSSPGERGAPRLGSAPRGWPHCRYQSRVPGTTSASSRRATSSGVPMAPPQSHESPRDSQNPGRRSAHSLCARCVCACACGSLSPHVHPCPTLCNPKGCSPPGSSVHGIVQARTLE